MGGEREGCFSSIFRFSAENRQFGGRGVAPHNRPNCIPDHRMEEKSEIHAQSAHLFSAQRLKPNYHLCQSFCSAWRMSGLYQLVDFKHK